MHDLSNASPVLSDSGEVVGYILKLSDDAWLPLDMNGQNYSGPTYEKDARDIVIIRSKESPTVQ